MWLTQEKNLLYFAKLSMVFSRTGQTKTSKSYSARAEINKPQMGSIGFFLLVSNFKNLVQKCNLYLIAARSRDFPVPANVSVSFKKVSLLSANKTDVCVAFRGFSTVVLKFHTDTR